MEAFRTRLKNLRRKHNLNQTELAIEYNKQFDAKIDRSMISKWETGFQMPTMDNVIKLAKFFNVSLDYLYGDTNSENESLFPEPSITEECATFKIIGNVAAGYNGIAEEQYDGDDIDIPISYLRGRPQSDFFVLRVKGQSMYPEYRDGDIALILKTPTLENSGDIGVVLYDGEMATLKKVEFVMGENWLKLIPLNPAFETKTIKNEELERCQILGVPKLLIRPMDNFI